MLSRAIIVYLSISSVSPCSRMDAIFKKPETISSIQNDALNYLNKTFGYLGKVIQYTKWQTMKAINDNLEEISTMSEHTAKCVSDEAQVIVPEAMKRIENSVKDFMENLERLKTDIQQVRNLDEAEQLRLVCGQMRLSVVKQFQKEVEKALSPIFETLEAKVAHCIKEEVRRMNEAEMDSAAQSEEWE